MRKTYLLLMSFGLWGAVAAQDANYWSASYNPAGFLMPGSAIAFTGDSGVLYFNPALLAYNTKNSATISGSIYQYNSLRIRNGTGDGLDLKSSNVGIIPAMASGILSVRAKRRFTLGYALIHNPVIAYQSTQQYDGKLNVLNDSYSPGPESFLAQYSAQNTINVTSGLLATGFQLSRHFAFGLSAEVKYLEQHIQEDYSARALLNGVLVSGLPPLTNVQSSYQISRYNIGLTFKAGFAYDRDRDHLGLTISSPLARVRSSGQLLSDYLVTDLRQSADDTLSFLASTRQTGLKEKWKMPVSIAGGYAHSTVWGQVYASAEYFFSVGEYNIITPRPAAFIRTNDQDNLFTSDLLKLKDARRSVLNAGIGLSCLLNKDITGIVSFRTDFTYADSSRYADAGDGYVSNTTSYNIYHLQIGGNIRRRKFNLRAGLLLDYGHTSRFLPPVSMTSANESNLLIGNVHPVRATLFSAGLMFAYIHNL